MALSNKQRQDLQVLFADKLKDFIAQTEISFLIDELEDDINNADNDAAGVRKFITKDRYNFRVGASNYITYPANSALCKETFFQIESDIIDIIEE